MREFLFYSIVLFLCGSTYAQNLNLISSVIESGSGTPVEGVIVEIAQTGLATKTQKDGRFRFLQAIPEGEHVLTISKENYVTGFFLLKSKKGKPLELTTDKGKVVEDKIEINVDKYEAVKRKRAAKAAAKEELKKLRAAKKEKDLKDKLLAKKLKQLQKNKSKEEPVVVNTDVDEDPSEDVITFSEAQFKYSEVLGVPIEELTNKGLYDFIGHWEGAPYLMGGATEEGIDCSAFAQRLFIEVNGLYLERTAHKQFKSKNTETFKDPTAVIEGDLIFFSKPGAVEGDEINHVGIYLHNNKFVSATSTGGRARGVKITNLNDAYWQSRFISFGRRINNK